MPKRRRAALRLAPKRAATAKSDLRVRRRVAGRLGACGMGLRQSLAWCAILIRKLPILLDFALWLGGQGDMGPNQKVLADEAREELLAEAARIRKRARKKTSTDNPNGWQILCCADHCSSEACQCPDRTHATQGSAGTSPAMILPEQPFFVREPRSFWRRRWRRRVFHNVDSSSSLTSSSGAILREASMCCRDFALPNGRRNPTNWAGRTLPYGRTSPTRRASSLRQRLPERLGAGVPDQTGGAYCLAARSLRVSYQTDGSITPTCRSAGDSRRLQ